MPLDLSAIVAAPDDDALRLLAADAVEATDPARAEHIRAWVALGAAAEGDDALARLEARAARARRDASWDADLRAIRGLSFTCARGFVDLVVAPAALVVEHAATLARHPVRRLVCEAKAKDAERLAASGALARLRALTLLAPPKAQLELLARPGVAPRLEELSLVTDAKTLAKLVRLDLFAGLRSLELTITDDADAAAQALADAGSLAKLEHLELRVKQAACGVPGHDGPAPPPLAGDAALARLAASARLRGLRSLRLDALEGAAGAAALGRMDAPALTSLVIEDLDEAAGPVLCASPLVAKLERLRLGYAGRRAVVALAANPGAARLRRLAIPGLLQVDDVVGDEGLTALARSAHLQGLRELELPSCHVGPAGVAAMADVGAFPALRTLNLQSENPLGPAGLGALARWSSLESVRTLYVSAEGDDPAATLAPLFASPRARGLERLDVWGPIEAGGEAVVRALAAADLPALSHFAMARRVNSASFTTAGAKALLASSTLPVLALVWARLLGVSAGAKAALHARYRVFDSQGESGLARLTAT